MIETFIEVTLKRPDDFLLVRETLTRIGVATGQKRLIQTAHIFHKKQRHYIVHFKQMFLLDGKDVFFSEDDRGRLNRIAKLLAKWDLVTLVKPEMVEAPLVPISQIAVIPYKDKGNWTLEAKYEIGKRKSQ